MAQSTFKTSGAIQVGKLGSAPSNPAPGTIYVDSSDKVLIYNGSSFNEVQDEALLDAILGTLNATPTNYTPSSATHAGHLDGIDTALGLVALGSVASSSVVTEIDGNVDDLITLSGVAENSTDLGTFSGAIISDNTDIKTALQELETQLGTVGGNSDFSDDSFRVSDDGDSSKKIAFQASAITTATVRTISMPDADVDLADVNSAIQSSEKGSANGVASLDGSGKVPVSQLPNAIMEYQGTWNASTNSPSLADGGGNADADIGNVYRVSVAGSQDLGSGSITFAVGDYVILNSSKVWEKADTTDAVSSVNSQTGAVVLDSDDISEGSTNFYYTEARFDSSLSGKSTTDLSEGTNLYYTQARFDSAFTAKDSDDLSEGSTNFYYTEGRFNTSLATKDTDDLTEGATNQYFTEARVNSTQLAGHVPAAGTLANGDQLDVALEKLDGNIALKLENLSEDSTPSLGGNLDIGTNVIIHGADGIKKGSSASDFYEEEYIHSISLGASQTGLVMSDLTFAHASFDAVEIVYKFKDSAGSLRLGTLRIVTDGTTASINDAGTEQGDTSDIVFNAAVNGANVEISYDSGSNTGTLRCEVKRFKV